MKKEKKNYDNITSPISVILTIALVMFLFWNAVQGQSYSSHIVTVVTPANTVEVGVVSTGFEYNSPVTNTVTQPVATQQPITNSHSSQNISVYYEKGTITLNKQSDGPRNLTAPSTTERDKKIEEARNEFRKDWLKIRHKYVK